MNLNDKLKKQSSANKVSILTMCYHCGNKLPLENKAHYENFVVNYHDEDERHSDFWSSTFWFLLMCPTCGDASLYRESFESWDDCYDGGYNIDKKILFPLCSSSFIKVPRDIKNAFEAALKVVNIHNNICLLSLRMVLEKVCNNKKAKGSNLKEMIEDLARKNILPDTLKDCSTFIRILGNEGAHGGEDISLYDVKEIIGFVESILHYLYELPYQIDKLNKKYKKL
ncbi:MAG: DUF4145 domain-containing protein [Erysipelotrichales bacterium]|nr:DUF4145 domain-containing protein [Erysipelotrichales bacterium]